jgi:hypothetical protein
MSRDRTRWWVLGLLGAAAALGFAASEAKMTSVALLCLAAIPASVAVPGKWRVLVGVLVATLPVGVLITSDIEPIAAVATAAAVVAGVLLVWRGRSWGPLTARYAQRSDEAEAAEPRDMWNALTRGEDPTTPEPENDAPGTSESASS